ncbi:MAG: hypothetical protein R3F34_11595 [Planctomycetota bacterium]
MSSDAHRGPSTEPRWVRVVDRTVRPLRRAAIVTLVVVGLLAIFVVREATSLQRPIAGLGKVERRQGDAVVRHLETYRERHGEYPPSLRAVANEDARGTTESRRSQVRWQYIRLAPDRYELGTIIGRWVSSYDLVVRRSDGSLPDAYRTESLGCEDVDGWTYVLGAENVADIRCLGLDATSDG